MERRDFLAWMGAAAYATTASRLGARRWLPPTPPDTTLRIGPVEVEIAPRRIIKTIGYNGSFPGPLLRVREGDTLTIDVVNDTKDTEFVHWHGLNVSSAVDGAMEEGTPPVQGHSSQRYSFVATPAGTRWYHSHVPAGRDIGKGTYSGQFGALYIDPKNEPGRYDAEVFLVLHGWDGYMSTGGDDDGTLDVIYKHFTVNSHALGFGEPVRVSEGQRVMFRIINASATWEHRVALAGHAMTVVSLDGNPVPTPREVHVLDLGPAERVDVIVTMNNPGVWILGEEDDKGRGDGLGVVVEYANRTGKPVWNAPPKEEWDYTAFGRVGGPAPDAQAVPNLVPLVIKKKFAGNRWVDYWSINGQVFPKADPIRVRKNERYRLIFDNQSDEAHPLHLHRHSFEITNFAGKPTSGVFKDVIVVPPASKVEVDFLADNPGPTLFHCHQQLHMDFGFMRMIEYME